MEVELQLVAVVQVVVDDGRQGVVGGGDGVDVARQVEVERLERSGLAVAATGRATLDPEGGAIDDCRMAAVARLPMCLKPWARPMVVVVLPSPSGVG